MPKRTFVNHSVKSAVDFFRDAIFSEEIARSRGFLQTLGPKVRLVLLGSFLLAACFAGNIEYILALYLVSCLLAMASSVNLIYFLKRVWFFIPIFTIFIAIPAVFLQGPYYAALFVMRVAACVSFTVVFTITTRHDSLLKSLRSMGVPGIFVQVLDMTYRYVFLFIRVFEEMHTGLESRLLGRPKGRMSRRWIASRLAHLFKRSVKMSEEVYMAMSARGYKG